MVHVAIATLHITNPKGRTWIQTESKRRQKVRRANFADRSADQNTNVTAKCRRKEYSKSMMFEACDLLKTERRLCIGGDMTW